MFITLPLPLAHETQLALVIDWLCRTIAAHIARDRAAGPLIGLVWTTVRRRANRLASLLVRFRAGRLTPPRPLRPAAIRSDRVRPNRVCPAAAPLRLPRGRAWLARLMPDTCVYSEQLRHLVANDPEMQALIAVSPQAARLLRSLFGMLTTDTLPAVLALPPAEPKASTEPSGAIPGRVPAGTAARVPSRAGRPRFREALVRARARVFAA